MQSPNEDSKEGSSGGVPLPADVDAVLRHLSELHAKDEQDRLEALYSSLEADFEQLPPEHWKQPVTTPTSVIPLESLRRPSQERRRLAASLTLVKSMSVVGKPIVYLVGDDTDATLWVDEQARVYADLAPGTVVQLGDELHVLEESPTGLGLFAGLTLAELEAMWRAALDDESGS